jgi:hypothetical protein
MAQDKRHTGIIGNEQELNGLFKELLDGIRDDIEEANLNVQMYLDAIQHDPGGKELYGSLYNEALKIKGSTRERQLKFVTVFGGRVGKKEDNAIKTKENTGSEFAWDHGQLNDFVSELKEKATDTGENAIPFIPPQELKQESKQPIKEQIPEEDEYTIDADDEWESDDSENDYDEGTEGDYDEED